MPELRRGQRIALTALAATIILIQTAAIIDDGIDEDRSWYLAYAVAAVMLTAAL